MQNKIVAVLGGSGFLGRYVVEKLARQGALLKVGCRRPEEAMHVQPMGNVGQIKILPVNIRDDHSVATFIQDSDVVINLVGILYEKGKQTFQALHVEGAKRVATLVASNGVSTLIQISALGADPHSASSYARSKGQGEQAVMLACPQSTIVRPSLVFGAEDQFFQKFAAWARLSPALPLLGGGTTLFQPVYVADVAEGVVKIIQEKRTGEIFEIAGPKEYTFRDLMLLMMDAINCHRLLIPVPMAAGYLIGAVGQLLPKPPLTIDQLRLLKQGSTLSGKHKTLTDLGIAPHALEALLPRLLARFRR